jgi:hypothetical protein
MLALRVEINQLLARGPSGLSDALTDDEWAALLDEGAIRELQEGTRTSRNLVDRVHLWRRVYRLNEPPPALLGPRPRGRRNTHLSWHQESVSDVLAVHAELETEHRFGVREFRAEVLDGRLLSLDQAGHWIEQAAANRGGILRSPTARAEVAGHTALGVETLGYARADSKWMHRVVVEPGSVLARLRSIARRLADFYGWDEAQATAFVLTGVTPLTHALRATVSTSSPLLVRSRIKMSIDPSTTPREVADYYRRVRQEAFGRIRRLGEKHARLAAFAARLPQAMDSNEQLKKWNDQCVKWRKPKWKFSHPSRFRIEAQKALDRLVELGKA